MGRKKGIPTCVIPIREKVETKKIVIAHAKRTGKSIQETYKQLLKEGKL